MKKLALLGAAAFAAALAALSQPAAACGFGDEACPVILASSKPLSLSPAAHDDRKPAKRSTKKKSIRQRDKDNDEKQALEEKPDGVAPGAFAAAARYMIVPPRYPSESAASKITVVSENELSEIDLLAGTVRVVEPSDANEIDLAVDEKARVANAEGNGEELRQYDPQKEDDGDIFNRVLMTFAGALAAASAMRVFIA